VGIYAGHHALYHSSQPGVPTGYEKIWSNSYWFGRVRA
jgi:hypothetical protein